MFNSNNFTRPGQVSVRKTNAIKWLFKDTHREKAP